MSESRRNLASAAFDILRGELDKRQENLLQELGDAQEAREKALRLQKDFLEDALLAMNHTCQFTATLLREATEVELATSHARVLARLETLQAQEVLLEPGVSSVVRITEMDHKKLSEEVEAFGRVATE